MVTDIKSLSMQNRGEVLEALGIEARSAMKEAVFSKYDLRPPLPLLWNIGAYRQ